MSLQLNDLRDMVSKKIHIDEYSSKMGADKDVIVISFKVKYYDPALELSNFLEKGYDWILDADVSSGEMEDGSYLVFVECLRRPSFPQNMITLLADMEGLTNIASDQYELSYHKDKGYEAMTIDAIKSNVPLSPREYDDKNPGSSADVDLGQSMEGMLESIKTAAGIPIKSKPVTDPELKHFVNLSKR